MFEYLKEYRLADMKAMMKNSNTPHHRTTVSLAGKTVVVSGATSGVGLAAAREVAKFGAALVLLARNEAKVSAVALDIERAYGTRVDYLVADFARLADVRTAAAALVAATDRIDIMIHSAGVFSTRRVLTPEGNELVFSVNHLAPFLLTCAVIPAMVRHGGRIIYVNSQGHRFNGLNPRDLKWERRLYTGLGGYGASKTAQLLTLWEFADRLEGTGISINAMHPGEVKSAIGMNNGAVYRWFKRTVVSPGLKDPQISGEAIHYLSAAPELEGVSGRYFNLTHPEKPAPHALDRSVGRVIWERSTHLTGVDYEPHYER